VIPVSLPAPIGAEPRRFTYLALAICVLGAAYIADRVTYWSGYWQNGAAAMLRDGPVTLSIGSERLRLPRDYIVSARRSPQSPGRDNAFDALRLSMNWPGLASARSQDAGSFRRDGPNPAIQVELEHNPGRESLRARLDPFYRRLARGGELAGPDGLRILTLSARGAAKTELIVFDPSVQNGFIARCIRPSSLENAACHRAILLTSGLELRYRFDQHLLPDWRQLDTAILGKIGSFRLSGAAGSGNV